MAEPQSLLDEGLDIEADRMAENVMGTFTEITERFLNKDRKIRATKRLLKLSRDMLEQLEA